MAEQVLSLEEWHELRNCVMEAAFTRQFRPPEHVTGYDEVLSLVRAYVETRDQASLDRAGRIVAALKPGVSAEIARNTPWLLLEKS